MSSLRTSVREVNPIRTPADQVRVTYFDPQLEEDRAVAVTPLDTLHGDHVALGFVDAEGRVVLARLTPVLATALRAALALADVPGAAVQAL